MSLCGKKSTKTQQDAQHSFPLPSNPQDHIGKIIQSKGQGNFEVQYTQTLDGRSKENDSLITALICMPSKFKNTIWVKRGTFVIFSMYGDVREGGKVIGEILFILAPKQIKHIKAHLLWPAAFSQEETEKNGANRHDEDDIHYYSSLSSASECEE